MQFIYIEFMLLKKINILMPFYSIVSNALAIYAHN